MLLVACARPDASHPPDHPFDPYERQNRKVHAFNLGVDRALIRPASKGYSNFLPDDIETAIGRFAFNLAIPSDVVNNVLQGNMKGAIQDTFRFAVNTTVGLGGFFDPATEMGLPQPTDTDFGETLYVWGAREGAYVELPLLGPGTERDTWGKAVDLFTNPLTYVLESPENLYGTAASVSSGLSNRGRYSDTIDSILYESADSYAQSRSIYLQNRRFELGKGVDDTYLDPYSDPYEDPYDE
ncbi:putative phospholipid-binding lipoprotein MlaA precursor [Roseovarius litorisediminis]|uniref:Putative phospholipid-binding lipoprotein MlaA n=2 Tax=Roseovarius litorisediminis TaxID=1312363 RepID=A0A1Y5S0B6_9RHOB|nr:putative phospholipid-binding lipoprotein MlaA precursor [Roseovarius litorisediminis]